jgi:tyrosyl-tRNA synthetase
VIWRYLELLSARSLEEIRAEREDVKAGRADVLKIKEAFALEIVTRFHDRAAAEAALERRRGVSAGGVPEDVPVHELSAEGGSIPLSRALATAGLVKSGSEGVRMIQQGAVHLDGRKLDKEEAQLKLEAGKTYLVRVGSKNKLFARLTVQ